MAAADITPMECGYCLRKDSALVDPKVLPCSHTHCLGCLTAFFKRNHVVRCPKCSDVYDVTLESLPAASPTGDDSMCCDTCSRKDVRDQPAITYCTSCSKKYCAKHQEAHNDLLEDHHNIEISEYRTQARKLEVRTCTEHGLQLSCGCKTCLIVICLKCILGRANDPGTCTGGTSHELKSLDDLVESLTKEINESKAEVADKEEKLEDFFKKMSEIIADYEAETGEMIEKIHQRRDEQVQAIVEKYQKLEKELVELRAQCKAAMTQFMEENVGRKLSDLTGHRMRIEARVRDGHQVDIVDGYRETKDHMQRLLDEVIPELELKETYKLDSRADSREIELKMFSESAFINWEKGLTISDLIPKSLRLLQSVAVSSYVSSVCSYGGNTYAGLYNSTISQIDGNYQLINSFLNLNGHVQGVNVYKERLYTLVQGNPYTVNVHDLTGQLITSWNHTDINADANKLAIINNQIIIPDRKNKRLMIYSLTGQILRHLPCPQLSANWVSICAAGADSVIVSDYGSNKVFRMSVSTGDIIWTSSHVTYPEGVVCYRGSCVLVASCNSDKIRILDMNTGMFISELTANGLPASNHVFDLHITGKLLVIPTNENMQVLFYQMDS